MFNFSVGRFDAPVFTVNDRNRFSPNRGDTTRVTYIPRVRPYGERLRVQITEKKRLTVSVATWKGISDDKNQRQKSISSTYETKGERKIKLPRFRRSYLAFI